MGARRHGRELALQALYQIEMTGDSSPEALELFWKRATASAQALAFGRHLVAGVLAERQRIDELIEGVVEHWRLSRLSRVDLGILRLGTFELLRCPEIPAAVTINEAIEIARRFGTEESPMFVNGVLDQVATSLGLKEKLGAAGTGSGPEGEQ